MKRAINISLFLVFCIAIGITVYVMVASPASPHSSESVCIDFSEGWSCTDAADAMEARMLPDENVVLNPGALVLTKTLPDTLPKDAVLCLRLNHSEIKVYVGTRELAVEGVYNNRALGVDTVADWGSAFFEQEDEGQTITLLFTNKNTRQKLCTDEIEIMSHTELIHQKLRAGLLPLLLVSSMTTLAFLMFAAAIICKHKQLISFEFGTLFYLALFIQISAVWILFDSKVLEVFIGYNDAQYFVSFFSLMLMPIPFALFARDALGEGRRTLTALAVLLMLAFLLNVGLLLAGVTNSLMTTLFVTHILIAILGIAVLYISFIKYMKSKNQDDKDVNLGITLFVILSGLALIIFYINREKNYSTIFRVGQMMMVSILCYSAIKRAFVMMQQAASSEINQLKSAQAQNNLLVSQISTHFFYHVMSTTRTLIKIDPDMAYKMLGDYAKYLRYKTDSNSIAGNLVRFSEELNTTKSYVYLKQAMLGDRLKVIYDIECQDFYIPVLTVQPLVENAIKHGIERKAGGGTLRISVTEEEDSFRVTVEDDGAGFDEKTIASGNLNRSVSSNNIRERLSYYGENTLTINSVPGEGTQVTLRFVKGMEKKQE